MSIISSRNKCCGFFTTIFFFFFFLFASGLKCVCASACCEALCTRQPLYPKRTIKLPEKKTDGWWLHFFFFLVNPIRPYHIRYECNCHVIWLFIVSFFSFTRWIDVDAFLIGQCAIVHIEMYEWLNRPETLKNKKIKMPDSSKTRRTLNCVINMNPKNFNAPTLPLLSDTFSNTKENEKSEHEFVKQTNENDWIRSIPASMILVVGRCVIVCAAHGAHRSFNFIFSFINTCCWDI